MTTASSSSGGRARCCTLPSSSRTGRPWRKQVGLDDLHIHDLRHTALTWAARSGATLAELMAIAGHKNPTIALRYQHIGDEERRHAIAEKVGAAFTDELTQRRARRTTGGEGAGQSH
ncbi:hypothetical protein FE374_07030 [Georgenia yuyongxinii]|uniref:Tyr recombinase domain-containing protein n=1 Tax=Georgenia yuyongxinii TaxID=2589797 RepID=A0A5B8C4R7_9MICO|nr:hypothetical protein FE374_07030 [Georgenia yuyongxinii]